MRWVAAVYVMSGFPSVNTLDDPYAVDAVTTNGAEAPESEAMPLDLTVRFVMVPEDWWTYTPPGLIVAKVDIAAAPVMVNLPDTVPVMMVLAEYIEPSCTSTLPMESAAPESANTEPPV